MPQLLVLRHAQSQWNAAGRWQGWSDAPLSELGVEQAMAAGRSLAAQGLAPSFVASSDLERARRTAELLAGELGYVGDLAVDEDLREQDLGEWNGCTNDEIASRWPRELEARRAGHFGPVPGGEAADRFVERALGAITRLAARAAAEQAEGLVVTHGGVVIALEKALGAWARGNRHGNLSGWSLEVRGTPPELELVPLLRVDLVAIAASEGGRTSSGTVTGRG
ncbi:MAG TPA: histidine phosphatase family protein [Acidimicrobiales bacterium]|nr:histidine phosphatase family protein [Acidimicrobiales bacterium]